MKRMLLGSVLLLGLAGAAAAQEGAGEADSIVAACRAEPNEAARIACLELAIYRLAGGGAAGPSAAAPAAPAVTGIGAEQVEDRLADQGAAAPERAEPTVSSAEGTVVAFARDPRGQLVLVLADGQIWAQRDSDRGDVSLVEGRAYPVEIEEGFLSGYRMKFPDQQRVLKVERLR